MNECYVLVPRSLFYPEVLREAGSESHSPLSRCSDEHPCEPLRSVSIINHSEGQVTNCECPPPPAATAGLERTLSCQFPTLVLQHHWKDQISKGWRIIFKTNELQSTSCEKGKEPITFLVRPQRDPITRVVKKIIIIIMIRIN